jgi:hypothetical protein
VIIYTSFIINDLLQVFLRRFFDFSGSWHNCAMSDENVSLNGNENVGPAEETQSSPRGLPSNRSRTGKIARLPPVIRQQLNQRLQNGRTKASQREPRPQLRRALRAVTVSYGQLRLITPMKKIKIRET